MTTKKKHVYTSVTKQDNLTNYKMYMSFLDDELSFIITLEYWSFVYTCRNY